jgi:hypothetical protein
MGKGRDKRRRTTKRKDESHPAKTAIRTYKAEPLGGGPIDPYALVLAPLRPRPPVRSGAIALPEPEEPKVTIAIGRRLR